MFPFSNKKNNQPATPTYTWEIDKSFSFCYGHRVFTQVINTEFTETGHTCPKCRHIHGHEGLVKIFLRGTELNQQGMVEDFVNLGWVKNFLDDHLDHKFVLSTADPWFVNIINARQVIKDGSLAALTATQPLNTKDGRELKTIAVYVPGTSHFVGYEIDVEGLSGPEKEFYEGYFLVNFVPTSEKLCEWLFHAVDAKMKTIGVEVSRVSWNETPKSRAVFTREMIE